MPPRWTAAAPGRRFYHMGAEPRFMTHVGQVGVLYAHGSPPTLADVMILATFAALMVALPLSVIAAFGFRDAPFGAVLKPIPVLVLVHALLNAVGVLRLDIGAVPSLALSSVAVAASLVAAVNGILVLTERRAV